MPSSGTSSAGTRKPWLQEKHPLTRAYLKKFEELLRERKAFLKFFNPATDPFYSMHDVGEAAFAKHKVAWMDIPATASADEVARATAERAIDRAVAGLWPASR